MAKPDIVIVDGHAFSWQRLCELRRQQLEARQAAQALSELDDAMQDCLDLPEFFEGLVDDLNARSDAAISQLSAISERVSVVLPGNLGEISEDLAHLFENEIRESVETMLNESASAIVDALATVHDQSHQASQILANVGHAVLAKLGEQVESTIKEELHDAVKDIAETAVTSTIIEIAESLYRRCFVRNICSVDGELCDANTFRRCSVFSFTFLRSYGRFETYPEARAVKRPPLHRRRVPKGGSAQVSGMHTHSWSIFLIETRSSPGVIPSRRDGSAGYG